MIPIQHVPPIIAIHGLRREAAIKNAATRNTDQWIYTGTPWTRMISVRRLNRMRRLNVTSFGILGSPPPSPSGLSYIIPRLRRCFLSTLQPLRLQPQHVTLRGPDRSIRERHRKSLSVIPGIPLVHKVFVEHLPRFTDHDVEAGIVEA